MSDDKRNAIEPSGPIAAVIRFCLENKLVVALLFLFIIVWGLRNAPFDWELSFLPRDPVAVDAIPDIGENQQIVFTDWPGRSPQDVDDQITYPLTTALLGVPGVKTVRSYSMFGFSSIYIIFNEKVEFYWSRSRILEKLNSLPAGTLPEGVQPMLGPDATALGQVFWYTLEGRDAKGNPTGGWDLEELRTAQDWYVRYALLSAEGISEVASIGGFQKEYQIDVDPDAMRAYNVSLSDIFMAVRASNVDVGARTIEINKVEYIIRGLGFIKKLSDVENIVVKVNDNVPVYVKNVGVVSFGPALRRGAIDKGGAEAVGGIVVVRYGFNPLEAIKNVKKKIEEIAPGLPKKTLPDGTVSQVSVVPYYDRTGLIYETLGTLKTAITEEILITIIIVIVMLMHLRSSVLISALLPLAVLMCFITMKQFGVDANVVALSGIAIAIGTMVDMGVRAAGITCAKLSEAEKLVAGGIMDVLIANQVVGQGKTRRLAALNRTAKVRSVVDSTENVRELDDAAREVGAVIPVLVEVDVGMGRCGVPPGSPAIDLARQIAAAGSLQFDGLQGYEGHLVCLADRRTALCRPTRRCNRLCKRATPSKRLACRSRWCPPAVLEHTMSPETSLESTKCSAAPMPSWTGSTPPFDRSSRSPVGCSPA